MDLKTISDLFDIKLNAFSGGIHKDEYEKSLYLTAAQDVFYNMLLSEFEATSIISNKLARLVKELELTSSATTTFGGHVIDFGESIKTILRERVVVSSTTPLYDGRELIVHEERLAEIEESLKNPFRTPNGNAALRALIEATPSGTVYFNRVELYLLAGLTLTNYKVIVAKKANPIILEDLPDGLEVDGVSTETAELSFADDDIKEIVQLAVATALDDVKVFAPAAPEK